MFTAPGEEIKMETVIITSFCIGLIFGGIATAAVSINEIHSLRKILSVSNSENKVELFET